MKLLPGLTCRISTGASVMSLPLSVQPAEDVREDVEERDADDRREIEWTEGRQEPAPEPKVGVANVVEKALDPVQPQRVRQPHPRGDDVGEDQDRIDVDEDLREADDAVDRVVEQAEHGN